MPDYTVDLNGLDALGKNLDRCGENLDGALKSMEDVGPDTLGNDDLDDACEEFREDWEYGLSEIRKIVKGIKENLDASKQNYAELENALSNAFSTMRDKIGGGAQ
ncbi:hypothetical protein LWC34_34570 [Kibdelosporangium philippinense]|uniref:Excreted virulence factor EspC, type VII ESX diderm n=1 Tax=Kibdelosporangium philippinense TaxID=211113 RepID=A0ABS8ZJD7_9PSEU|nr:hypothetical protein [Kibdelosporangium philippinense]MCE7007909.1 hypothetical protein [Kibdelosporangium philippinense]